MELVGNNHGFDSNLPTERIAFKITSNAKMFSILSDGIYKDKILAVIRELSCNAHDALIAANKREVPFVLTFPSRFESTFSVEDAGTGIPPDKIGDIFWTYGASTKSESNDFIGALGLGSKSPFAYTKSSFIVKNRYEGKEYIYFCFINENGTPDGSLVSTEPTENPSGITVEFAVRPEDNHAFQDRASRFFRYWQGVRPEIKGISSDYIYSREPISKVMTGKDWFLEDRSDSNVDHKGAIAMMGNVPYPIDADSIPNLPGALKSIAKNSFVITFPMGSISFTASRESLEYSVSTNKLVIAKLEEVRLEIAESFHSAVFKDSKTHIEFMINFKKAYEGFRNTVKCYDANGSYSRNEEGHIQMLLGKNQAETILFRGHEFLIKGLIEGNYENEYDGHEIFGLYSMGPKGRRAHVSRLHTKLTYQVSEELDGTELYDSSEWRSKSKIDKGETYSIDWKDKYVGPRSSKSSFVEKLFSSSHPFKVTTAVKFSISSGKELLFIINDCGSVGPARFQAYEKAVKDSSMIFFVNFNPKATNIVDVTKSLEEFIKMGLEGSKICNLSSYPDLRPQIEKVKAQSGTIKLRSANAHVSYKNTGVSYGNHTVTVNSTIFSHPTRIESIHNMTDLKKFPVLCVLKKRTEKQFYDDADCQVRSIYPNLNAMSYATHLGFFEGTYGYIAATQTTAGNVTILVLTGSQYDHLKKKGVNLVFLKSSIEKKIEELEKTEKFTSYIKNMIAMSRVKPINDLYEVLDAKTKGNLIANPGTSLFKKTIATIDSLKNAAVKDPIVGNSFIKISLYDLVSTKYLSLGESDAKEITKEITKAYPMLNYVSYYGGNRSNVVKDIIHYLEDRDSKIQSTVEDTII